MFTELWKALLNVGCGIYSERVMLVNVLGIKDISETILFILDDFSYADRIRRIGVFGSVARNESTTESDIDFVIDYEYAACSAPEETVLEVKKWLELEELLRVAFSPAELSVINLDAPEQCGDVVLQKEIESDVVWVYEAE